MDSTPLDAVLYLGDSPLPIPLDTSHHSWQQPIDHRGRPRGKVRFGRWFFSASRLGEAAYRHLLELMLSDTAVVDARAEYSRADGQGILTTVWGRRCTVCHFAEHFDIRGTNGQQPSWVLYFSLAAEEMGRVAGAAGTFVLPEPRSYAYVPPAAVAAPTPPTAPEVRRLPRITGDPPFSVTPPKKNKPDMDRAEFVRQLTGQQDGMNRLTVAEFLANRDHYLTLSQQKGDGRDPLGGAAQKVAREKAFERKMQELQLENDDLTESEAAELAEQWLKTQTALHDPDQVAGGHPHLITGMGDGRVNFAIGAQWRKRIKGIDQQIRTYATSMSQQERAITYLNIILPLA